MLQKKTICPECYSEYPRITPFFALENCLKNHKQYKCRTCGRLVCIDKNTEISYFSKFNFKEAARYLLRGGEAFFKEECAVFEKRGNNNSYFQILPVYGNLSSKKPACFLPTTYRQAVKKQTGLLSEEEVKKYILEQNEERRVCDYSQFLEENLNEQNLEFKFTQYDIGIIKCSLKTKYESFCLYFYDDENSEVETSDFVMLAKWFYKISSEKADPSDIFKLFPIDGDARYIKAENGFLRVYEFYSPSDENLRLSCFCSYKVIFDNYKSALKSFLKNGYNSKMWERLSFDPDDDAYYDGFEGAPLEKIYECIEKIE